MNCRPSFFLLILLPAISFAFGSAPPDGRKLKKDEEICFYPSIGSAENGKLVVRGRVSDPERHSGKRKFFLSKIAGWMGFTKEEKQSPYFYQRGLLFLEEEAEDVRVTLSLPKGESWVAKSGDEGYFENQVTLSSLKGQERYFRFVSRSSDGRRFKGSAWLLADHGFSIISDIDDTVKVTGVRNQKEMLKNTFVRPFEPVPGMAELYRRMLNKGGSLHFVSAGPRQLISPLKAFLEKEDFPPASFHMRFFHLDPKTIREISSGAEDYKVASVQSIVERFPKRRFLLVGDSGEKDPEVYSRIYHKFKAQISGVWIRNVTDEPFDSPRYKDLFPPEAPLQIFLDPKEIKTSVKF